MLRSSSAATELASAPEPPHAVAISGAVTPDTTVSWKPAKGAKAYRVWWRDTTAPQWRYSRVAEGGDLKLIGVNIDDWFFGVSAIGPDGYESPVAFPGTGGFDRLAPTGPVPSFITSTATTNAK